MNTPGSIKSDISRLLAAANRGDHQAAADLLPLVYDELRKLAAAKMAAESPDHTLDATALVHEAYIRLAASPGNQSGEEGFANRAHFFAAAAESMRRILVENARRKLRIRHGGTHQRRELHPDLAASPELNENLIVVDAVLRTFAERYPVHARLVELRYFAGLTGDEAANLLSISTSTADRHWIFARAWLRRALKNQLES